MRVAINGFGRIGRCVLRAILEKGNKLDVIAINDSGDRNTLMHLLKYDSIHGKLNMDVELEHDMLNVSGRLIQFFNEPEVEQLPWGEQRIDLVLECSGHFKTRELASGHLEAGAGRVLVGAPVKDADIMVVYGVNHQQINADHRVISNASCTTNCLAPIAKVLDEQFGIVYGQMTTIHAYTNDQHLVDTVASDLYRARAGALSIIPTKTGAAAAVGLVLPSLQGKLDGMAVRVPTADVSILDLHCTMATDVSVEDVNQAMLSASRGAFDGVMAYNTEPLVSVDFFHHPASAIFDANHTRVIGRQLKVMAWYDNEWGFASRMVDVAHHLAT